MRYIGIALMAVSAVGGGFLAAKRWRDRLDILCMFRQMIYHLKSRILYSNEPLPEALYEVGSRFSEGKTGSFAEPGKLFLAVAERARENRNLSFSVIWKEAVESIPKDCPLAAADRQNLSALGENLGYADRGMQERTLLFYLEQTDDAIAFLKKEADGRMKLYRSLGVAAGLFLFVLLV